MSPRLKRFIGFEDDEFPNSVSAWASRIHPDDIAAVRASIQATQEGRAKSHQAEYRIRHKDGSWRWILTIGQIYRDAAGLPVRWAGIDWDITGRKLAEAALRDSEERFRVAQELSPDGFLIFRPLRDDAGVVTDFLWIYENDAAGPMN